MKQTESSSREHVQLRCQVAGDQPEMQPLVACLWMAIAFIVGTFVFEMAATGAEPPGDAADEIPQRIHLGAALDRDETNVSLATSSLESLHRIHRNAKLMPLINQMIEFEATRVANQKSAVELASHDGSPEGDAGANTIMAALPGAPGDEQTVARDRDPNSPLAPNGAPVPGDDSIDQPYVASGKPEVEFEPVHVRSTPSDESANALIYGAVGVAQQVTPAAEPVDAQPESNQTDAGEPPAVEAYAAAPVSIGTLDVPVLETSKAGAATADSTIVHAPPISLLQTLTTPDNESTAPSVAIIDQHADVAEVASADEPTIPTSQVEFAPVATKAVVVAKAVVAEPTRAAVAAPAEQAVAAPATTAAAPWESLRPSQQQPAVAASAVEVSEPIRQPEERIAAKWPLAQPAATNQPAVSLNVDNADVRTVFEMLARGYGMNILVAPGVTGSVTANVDGLTPDQTLQGVMKMCNLRAQVDGNVIYVYPADSLPSDARQLRLFPLDFARAAILEPIVQGLLSPIGNAYASAIDGQDNLKTREAIVVIDTPETIAQIESYIFQADQPPRQVMIEAHVLEVDLKDDFQRGVNLKAILGRDLEVGSFGLADTVATTTNPLFYAQLKSSDVESLVELVETTTDAKTLASPRVMVVNGQEAKIQVGQQLGFAVATVTQTSTIQDVQFLDTGVVLNVKPTISRDHKILMDVKPEVSSGEINPDTLLPEEETRELQTSILLNDHQGIVIGGLIQERDSTLIRKLPFLGDIKLIGRLFQRREAVRSRSEIIISLVAHIVDVEQHPRGCYDHEADQIQLQRTVTPLLYGPLQRNCRPWEPRLPDPVSTENCMDVNKVNRMIP